jgi:hypothetical protein
MDIRVYNDYIKKPCNFSPLLNADAHSQTGSCFWKKSDSLGKKQLPVWRISRIIVVNQKKKSYY